MRQARRSSSLPRAAPAAARAATVTRPRRSWPSPRSARSIRNELRLDERNEEQAVLLDSVAAHDEAVAEREINEESSRRVGDDERTVDLHLDPVSAGFAEFDTG